MIAYIGRTLHKYVIIIREVHQRDQELTVTKNRMWCKPSNNMELLEL